MRSAGLPHTLPCLLRSFLWPLCLSGCQWYLALIISHLPLSLLITRPGLSPCNYLGSVSPWGRISGPGRERMWDKVWLWLGGRHRRPQADPLPLNHRKHLQYHSRRLSGQVEESIFLECSKRSKRLYLKAILEFSFPSPFTLMYHHLLGWHCHSYATRPGWYAN